jgi:ribose transport system substrate-binding protein
VLVIAAAACSDDDGDEADAATTTAAAAATTAAGGSAEPGKTVRIVASVPPTDHGWLGQVAAKAQEAADQWPDVEFRLLEAADADGQASQIQTVINEKPDALVVLPYDGDQLTPVAEQAMEAGIPVINVDRLFATPEAARATILGDNYDIGAKAAEFISGKLNCEGNVVEIQGIAGISVTEQRSAGFADTLDQLCGDGIEIVAQQPADFEPDKGLEVMETILQGQDEIDGVYTHDDDMAEGVVSAIENAGREDEMFLTGAGGSTAAMERIQDGGLYTATFMYNPSMSASAIRVARLIALDQGFEELVEPEVPSRIELPASTVTADNVDDYIDLGF